MQPRSRTPEQWVQHLWYGGGPSWARTVLTPLSWLYLAVSGLRRAAYRSGIFRSIRVARPVLVVGNITVGGVGKTPLTMWLASRLQARGVRVGVVLRGYGGRSATWPREVSAATPAAEVGDEAVLIAARTGAIVIAGPDRVSDARLAIERGAEVVLSDDGLQHYRLARDAEIAVVDAQRGLGNARALPAGPLREPPSRLRGVDVVVMTQRGGEGDGGKVLPVARPTLTVTTRLQHAVNLTSGEVRDLRSFSGRRVHALAGVGNPQAFFAALTAAGLEIDAHPFPDHAHFTAADLQFGDDAPVLMTEKDAVKCRAFADQRCWAAPLELEISDADAAVLNALLERVLDAPIAT